MEGRREGRREGKKIILGRAMKAEVDPQAELSRLLLQVDVLLPSLRLPSRSADAEAGLQGGR
jgi:hypothetical protein